jgi:hypothetical protein
MALYVPASTRRRRTILIAAATALVGLLVGLLIGRSTATSVADRVSSVRADARRTSASLRVIVLHDESGVTATGSAGDSGTDLVLERTRKELDDEFRAAPWLGAAQHDTLNRSLDALVAQKDKTSAAFGQAAEALAADIDTTFGVTEG